MKKLFFSILMCFLASNVYATVLIDAGQSSTVHDFLNGNYCAGTEFTLSGSIVIDGLGFLDIGNNGLTHSHKVGLWNQAGSLLTNTVVSNLSTIVNSASLLGRWYVEQIPDLVLNAGTYRVAAFLGNEADSLSDDKIGNGVTLSSGYVRTSFPSGGFAFPNLTFTNQAIHATVTANEFLNQGGQVVPETSSMLLLGLGLIGFSCIFRKKIS